MRKSVPLDDTIKADTNDIRDIVIMILLFAVIISGFAVLTKHIQASIFMDEKEIAELTTRCETLEGTVYYHVATSGDNMGKVMNISCYNIKNPIAVEK